MVSAACSSTPDITGTYELQTLNGKRPPVQTARQVQRTILLIGGSITLNPNGDFRERLIYQVQTGAGTYQDSTVQTGQYTRRMSTVRLLPPGGAVSGRLSGPMLTFQLGSWTYVFQRPEP